MPLGHYYAVLMNRIGGVGRHHRVAGANDRKQQMGERVLGADGDDGFNFRVDLDTVNLPGNVLQSPIANAESRETWNSGDYADCARLPPVS